MWMAEADDVSSLVHRAQSAGVLVACDEVATGFGRTGTLFASEQCGIRPDPLCLGKGITGGYLPMSAHRRRPVAEAFFGEDLGPATFYHGHSYGGNALAAAVAHEHLRLLQSWDVLANVPSRAEQLGDRLRRDVAVLDQVASVRQRGLMAGIELDRSRPEPLGPAGVRLRRRRGALLRPLGDVVVVLPILTSTAPEIDRIVDTLVASIHVGCT